MGFRDYISEVPIFQEGILRRNNLDDVYLKEKVMF